MAEKVQDQLEDQHFVEWQKRVQDSAGRPTLRRVAEKVQDQLEDQHFVEWQKRCKISWKTNTS